jgi:glycosyltransferase involved in cell wall biosynthesis
VKASTPPLLLSIFASFAIGGPQVRFASVANHYGRAFRHAIVAMDGRLDCAERLAGDLDFVILRPPVKQGLVSNLADFSTVIHKLSPAALVTHNWGSIEWAMANLAPGGVRHLHLEDGFGPDERDRQLSRRVLARRFVLRRSLVVLPSETLLDIATNVWRLPPAHLVHVPNGLDLQRFRPAPDRMAPPVPVIGTVAALRAEKNLGRLLRAARLLHDHGVRFRLDIVGDGPDRAALEDAAHSLGLDEHVRFVGAQADPSAAYRDFDIFALSSDTEQMPLSVLEAMASGLPVAATAVGDVPRMLAGANRPFATARSHQNLAGLLHHLLRDGDLRRRLGAANREKAERDYDQQTMFRAYGDLFAARGAPGRPWPRDLVPA